MFIAQKTGQIMNEYKPTSVSHPVETLIEYSKKNETLGELEVSFWMSRVDSYADYIAEKRLQEYIGMPFLCKFFDHKYKITRWNRWYIPNHRKCARRGKEQEHTFALKNEDGSNAWTDVAENLSE